MAGAECLSADAPFLSWHCTCLVDTSTILRYLWYVDTFCSWKSFPGEGFFLHKQETNRGVPRHCSKRLQKSHCTRNERKLSSFMQIAQTSSFSYGWMQLDSTKWDWRYSGAGEAPGRCGRMPTGFAAAAARRQSDAGPSDGSVGVGRLFDPFGQPPTVNSDSRRRTRRIPVSFTPFLFQVSCLELVEFGSACVVVASRH